MANITRPQFIDDKINKLLSSGTVLDIISEEGKFLREFLTTSEASAVFSLPMPECPNFDGLTCDACRGMTRFRKCEMCHGSREGITNYRAIERCLSNVREGRNDEEIDLDYIKLYGNSAKR